MRSRPCRKAKEKEEEERVCIRCSRKFRKCSFLIIVYDDGRKGKEEEKLGECWEEDIGRTNEPAQALMNINPAEPAKNTRTERTLLLEACYLLILVLHPERMLSTIPSYVN